MAKSKKKSNKTVPRNGSAKTKLPVGESRFKPGDPILSCQPWVYTVAASDAQIRCHSCLCWVDRKALKAGTYSCKGCGFAEYCSLACQDKDAKDLHSQLCDAFRKMKAAQYVPDDRFLLLLQAILRLKKGQLRMKQPFEGHHSEQLPETGRSVDDLVSHLEDIQVDEKLMTHVAGVRKTIYQFLGMKPDQWLDPARFTKLFGQIQVNMLRILANSSDLPTAGYGVYLAASAFDHSCTPNAGTIFRGPELFIRATKDISNRSDIRISYLENLTPRAVRQSLLMEQYFFSCKCKWCTDSDLEAKMFGVRCGSGYCSRILPLDSRAQRKCEGCGFSPYDTTRLTEAQKLMVDSTATIARLKELDVAGRKGGNRQSFFRELEAVLAGQYRFLHHTNPVYAATCHLLAIVAWETGAYWQAGEWMEFATCCYRKWLAPHDARLGWALLSAAKAKLALTNEKKVLGPEERKSMLNCAEEAERIFRVTHGTDLSNPVYAETIKTRISIRSIISGGFRTGSGSSGDFYDSDSSSSGFFSSPSSFFSMFA